MRGCTETEYSGWRYWLLVWAGLFALWMGATVSWGQEPEALVSLPAPLDRVIHDNTQGIAIQARVHAVSAREIEFEDRRRGMRFAVPLDRLRRDHREFFVELHAKVAREARLATKRAAPETSWQTALRADLLAVARGETRLRALPEGWFGDAPFVVVMLWDDRVVYDLARDMTFGDTKAITRVEAPVVWLAGSKDARFNVGQEAVLPANHAVLVHTAWRRATERVAQADERLANEVRGGLFAGVDERVEERRRRLREVVPDYWPRAPWFEYWTADMRRLDEPNRAQCFLFTRDGRIATYRGAVVAGGPAMVAVLLETRFEALARENAVTVGGDGASG